MGHLRNGAMGLSVGVLALFACSRVASQTNFIGHPCKLDADCPSDLVCANEGNGVQTCQNRCLAGATCQDPSQTCINGACLSGARSGGADGGDFNTTVPDSGFGPSGTDGGNTSSGGTMVLVGTTIVKDVTNGPSGGGSNMAFAAEGTLMAFSASVPGQFGGNDTAIQILHTDTQQFETVGKYTQGSTTQLSAGPVLYSGSAFWLENNSGNSRIMKGTPGNAGTPVAISNSFAGGGGGADSGVVVAGKYLYFFVTGTPAGIGVYDLTSGTLGNPTTVDSAAAKTAGAGGKGSSIVYAGGSVYWVHAPPAIGQDAPIWTGLPGATGAVSGSELIPGAAVQSFAGLYAGPSGRFFATSGAGGGTYTFYDATSTATQRLQLTTTGTGSVVQIATDQYALSNNGTGTTTLNKYTLPSNTAASEETWGQNSTPPMRLTVSGNTAYWVESYPNQANPTQTFYRYATATIP